MAPAGALAVTLALLAAAPWTFALSGSDALFVAFALAPPFLMGLAVGVRAIRVRDARAPQAA